MTDRECDELLACLGQLRREWPELLAAARWQLAELSHRGSEVA
jgi:hypothetical protein